MFLEGFVLCFQVNHVFTLSVKEKLGEKAVGEMRVGFFIALTLLSGDRTFSD